MTLRIDVIIPSYNRAGPLLRAIESVLNQTYKQFDLYVVNDGSTDNTDDVVAPYLNLPNFHYLKQNNLGVSAARNLGIKTSQAEWFALLDSDDEWLPHKLETQVNFILANKGLRFIHSNEIWIRNGVRVNPKIKFDKSNKDIFIRSLEMCLISPSTALMKRELALKYDLFDESFEICEDYDLWLKILAHEEVGFITDHLVKKYGGHEDQLSTKYPAMDFWRIRSMINLLQSFPLDTDKKKWIHAEIRKKAEILLAGYIKHNHLDRHSKLTNMLIHLKPEDS